VFLANLNARRYIRGAGDGVTISNIEDIRFAAATAARGDAEASLATRMSNQLTTLGQMGSGETSSGAEGQETAAYVSERHLEASHSLADV
jgi:hypothetical protein